MKVGLKFEIGKEMFFESETEQEVFDTVSLFLNKYSFTIHFYSDNTEDTWRYCEYIINKTEKKLDKPVIMIVGNPSVGDERVERIKSLANSVNIGRQIGLSSVHAQTDEMSKEYVQKIEVLPLPEMVGYIDRGKIGRDYTTKRNIHRPGK